MNEIIAVAVLNVAIALGYVFGVTAGYNDIAHKCLTVGQFQQGAQVFKCGDKK